jgi:C4-dicarboxylate-specific signal transduction histidine kinase
VLTQRTRQRLRHVWEFVVDALSGRLGVLMMTLAYASFAVVLLAYVSTQVYTNSLMEDISARKHEEREVKERIARLTARYSSLTSRARVSGYCEGKLGMVQADATVVTRLSVEGDRAALSSAREFTEDAVSIPDVLGSEIGGLTEVIRK